MHRALVPPFVLLLVAALPTALHAQSALQSRVEDVLRSASPGTRFGLVVVDETGTEVVAINPDQRFIPASNTKMFTTAAAFWSLGALDQPDEAGGAAVRIEQTGNQRDVILEGHGDARLSSAPACTVDCLATLADAVAAKTHVVRDVVGDDSLYPDERWSPGMSWNNIPTKSGTATSALTLDDNELPVTVAPSTPGRPPTVTLPPYYTLENGALTTATGTTTITFDRAPNGTVVRLGGTIAVGSKPEALRLGIDDPAHYAAWMLRNMLVARGVRVTSRVSVRHRPLTPADDPAIRRGAPAARPPATTALARLTPPPLIEDLTHINKVSQNLHAELMLRRIALKSGSGSIADGQVAVRAMLAEAGVPRVAFDFADGSGMSSYNRVTPRGAVTFLRWVSAQPWGTAWRATLPVGGEGTLTRRFAGTALDHRLFAKTGTLNATNALSGYMIAKSGHTLTMAFYANDVPEGASATRAMDAALLLIASQN
ncbi:MAG: D-alanyl-D-alanine carboxypeptidase/D-alanyl-D-alanine-endopeptidase [Pseudomonadota bacterium]|jgi:D-alanyl-D-alanine carboxypeptidase/D-alanyl-D-alanine-endopeptidase (penicillin-binding protein 4)